ncbi:MAG: DNA polymerase I [Myxococcales bacterium]|nr:DNA polymerase I [Myxococcales bacterium]
MSEPAPALLPAPGDPQALYVIDISSFLFRAYHALPPLSNSRGEPTGAVHGVANMLMRLFREQQPAMVAVAMDSRGPSFRKELYPEYKANRPPTPEDLIPQLARVRELVDAWGVPVYLEAGLEADDLIATLVRRAQRDGLPVVIVSADKDLLQLVGEGVVMYDSMREKVFGVEETREKMGVGPEQVRDLLALMGDSSDNVPGVPSVGQKTAVKLLAQFGDLDAIYAHLGEVKGKLKERLAEHEDKARLSRELVTLREDLEIPFSQEALAFGGGDEGALRRLFRELEMSRLLQQLEPERASPAREPELLLEAEALEGFVRRAREAGRMALLSVLDSSDALRGRLIGLGLALEGEAPSYLPLGHRYIGAPAQLELGIALEIMRPLLEDPRLERLSADDKRERLIFAGLGLTLGGAPFDVGIASYLLDPGRSDHGLASLATSELDRSWQPPEGLEGSGRSRISLDMVEVEAMLGCAAVGAELLLELGAQLGPRMREGALATLFRDVELPLAELLSRVERHGVLLDLELLGRLSADAGAELTRIEAEAVALAGRPFNVASPRQLEAILFDELGLPVIKKTKTSRSTDHQVLEELALLHDLPAKILEHRSIAKLKGTYLDALPKQVDAQTRRVHTRFHQTVAATGRLSSSDPNLQNIPIRTALGRRIRDAFIPEPGWEMLSADYSQIELRILAHLSEDPELLEAYRERQDVHLRTATALFDCPADQITREQRARAKTVNFAVIYGQTQFALARNLRIERDEARRYIEAFFARYQGVARYMEETVEQARRIGYATTLFGRRRALADIRSRNRNQREAAERMARNTPLQGTAADIIKIAMVRVDAAMRAAGLSARMLLTVHDELVFELPPEEREPMEQLVREQMQGAAELRVPLIVELGWGASWGAAH